MTHARIEGSEGVIGYAQRDGAAVEVAADVPEYIVALLAAIDVDGLFVWSHGARSPLLEVLEDEGFCPVRRLHQLRRPLDGPVDVPPTPGGMTIRAFVVGQDEDALLRVNAGAFGTHAEQGRWTLEDVRAREAEAWFDPPGLLLAERDGTVIGFHWTKRHPDGLGEVYVLGVDPAAQGLGLGRLLLAHGLEYLRAAGCPSVLLYVDDDNEAARQLYRRFGFDSYDVDMQWTRG